MTDSGVLEAIYTTRALRKRKPDPVPEAVTTQILGPVTRPPVAEVAYADRWSQPWPGAPA